MCIVKVLDRGNDFPSGNNSDRSDRRCIGNYADPFHSNSFIQYTDVRNRKPPMQILEERPGDQDAIRAITQAAFAGRPYSEQTEAAIVDALRVSGALAVSLVAIDGGETVGHIAFSPVTINGADCGWFGLGPVSVTPDRQGEGIGSRLVRAGLAMLKDCGASGCVLLGDPRYYSRFGFAADANLRYPGVRPEYFQALAFDDTKAVGTVAFHPGFAAR